MTTPIQFYRIFRDLLKEQGIRALLTSGMACVEYGIQETTKDTDWIIHLDDFENLVAFLCRQEKGLSGANWRISYRGIFGAPLSREYHQGGWTSHLAIWNHALAPEEHLDFFGRPPRVNPQLLKYESGLIASRSTVASMKKTDRQKDWPFVNGLAAQEWLSGEQSGLLHLRDLSLLRKAWGQIGKEQRQLLSTSRPLLNCIDDCSDILLERFLLIEKKPVGTREPFAIPDLSIRVENLLSKLAKRLSGRLAHK
ncbi:hypothetical protein QQ056_03470 [Oscillatoria laete-virens NRMC-F 0139]|nr:hypothetical protein [Oscillatoria laete-virens]MDL5052621.1 hypothetical protein [Oscillatoria laete-virens NRMC-F 0139]